MVIKDFMKSSSPALPIPFYLRLLNVCSSYLRWAAAGGMRACAAAGAARRAEGLRGLRGLPAWLSGVTQMAKNSLKCDISTARDKRSQDAEGTVGPFTD